jgi:secretion/DNA translocation related TadE-like protein
VTGHRRLTDGSPCAHGRDVGSGVVLVLTLCAVIAALGLGLTAAGGAIVARHRADSAADLAALAAAGPPLADCTRADAVAVVSGARVVACTVLADGSVVVTVAATLPGWLDRLAGGRRPLGRARAGRPAPGETGDGGSYD